MNLALFQGDERGDDADSAFLGWACFRTGANHFVVGLIVFGATVGVAGAVLLDGADVDLFRAQDLSPADGDGEEMGIAEGDVGNGDGQRTEAREREAFLAICAVSASNQLAYRNDALASLAARPHGSNLAVPDAARRTRPRAQPSPLPTSPSAMPISSPVAVSWAEVLGAEQIYIGAVEQDSSGYPTVAPNTMRPTTK